MQEEQNRFHLQRVSEAESLSLATPSIVNVFCFLSLSSPSQFFTCRGCLWPSFFFICFFPPWSFYGEEASLWGTGDGVCFLGTQQAGKTDRATRNWELLILFLSLIQNNFKSCPSPVLGFIWKFLGQEVRRGKRESCLAIPL